VHSIHLWNYNESLILMMYSRRTKNIIARDKNIDITGVYARKERALKKMHAHKSARNNVPRKIMCVYTQCK
jgi:ribosomal protein S17